jgi:hypothetical protein
MRVSVWPQRSTRRRRVAKLAVRHPPARKRALHALQLTAANRGALARPRISTTWLVDNAPHIARIG